MITKCETTRSKLRQCLFYLHLFLCVHRRHVVPEIVGHAEPLLADGAAVRTDVEVHDVLVLLQTVLVV
jgi:hypothetical protein